MRNNGQNKRMRGRNRKSHNPLARLYESNGPDVKIRGTASHIAEKYLQLARDSQSSGDPVAAENYYQHAEHYFRLIAAAQEQFRQTQPYYREGEQRDESYEESDAASYQGQPESHGSREREPYAPREQGFQQPYPAREAQPFGLREPQPFTPRPPSAPNQSAGDESELGLPAFITGGGQTQPVQQNGYDNQERFGHRRRRRHRGPRPEGAAPRATEGSEETSAGE